MFQGGAVDGVRVDATSRRLAPALTFSYTLYLARVGGDFMYARMLIPVTPLLLVLLEERLAVLLAPRPATRLGLTAAVVLAQRLLLDKALPNMPVEFDGVRGRMLRWDPEVLAALAARGACFSDVPALIDQYVARLSEADDASVRHASRRLKTFYFDHVADEAREAPFRARLALRQSRP